MCANSIRLTLSYPPYTNAQYTHARNGQVVLAPEVKEYRARAGWEAKAQMKEAEAEMATGELEVTINLYRPRKSGDSDGAIKQLLDALNGIAYLDDSQIVRYEVVRGDDPARPRVEVEIQEVSHDKSIVER